MSINRTYIITFGLIEGVDARAITIQREQYGGIVYLFIGTGRSPSKNTFMTLTYTHNRNMNRQGLASLFLFDPTSCLTLVVTLSRSYYSSAIASAFIVITLGYIFVLKTFYTEEDFKHEPKLPVIINIMLKTNG